MLDRSDENGLYPLVRVAAMVGNPVEENPLDLLFNRFLERGQVPLRQLKFHVDHADDLAVCLEGARKMGFVGFGVTVPYKTDMPALCDDIVPDSQSIGAINTVIFEGPDRRAVGRNTDGVAAITGLQRITDVTGAHVVILGAGGVARGIGAALADAGVGSITVAARRAEQGESVVAMLAGRSPRLDTSYAPWVDTLQLASVPDIIVNATPVGAAPAVGALDLDWGSVSGAGIAVDVVTGPRITPFITSAHEAGMATIDGVDMLVDIVHINIGLFGVDIERDDIDAYARELSGLPIAEGGAR
ncbi:MAG: shikimate dehydrogenase [Actinomycetota bacterium]